MEKERAMGVLLLAFALSAGLAAADEGFEIGASTAQAILARFSAITLFVLAGLAAAMALWYKRMKHKGNWLWLWGAALLALGLGYSVLVFFAEEAEKGIVVCETPEKCIISMHTHTALELTVCGEEKELGLEAGPLAATHTHKERNYLHFHERLPYDPAAETILDTAPLRVGGIFEAEGVTFTHECFYDKCNGDTCPGAAAPGKVSMQVNGAENAQFQDYVWKDGDRIRITFG